MAVISLIPTLRRCMGSPSDVPPVAERLIQHFWPGRSR
jgi:hypothetical protein